CPRVSARGGANLQEARLKPISACTRAKIELCTISSMRLLLLNLYYPPDTSATAKMAHSVVEALSSSYSLTVLCGRPSYDPTERRPWRPFQTEIAGRARIIRAGSTDFPRFSMKKRVVNYLSYVALAIPRALFVPCDAIVAMTDPPFQGIVGAIVALLKRSEEHTSELQSRSDLVCRLLLEKK